jgi:hypothetical protein
MPPKIPQLKRENASLRDPQPKDPANPVQEAGTNQKIPQTHPPKKVWWEVIQEDPKHDSDKET